MFTTISIILVLVSLLVILAIIIKKFPALAILDASNMPGEKEAKFKNTIIKARVERDMAKWSGFLGRIFLFVNSWLIKIIKGAHLNLKKMKLSYKAGAKIPWPEKQKQIKDLLAEAEELIKKEQFNEAEEKLVEVISLDQKNLGAFFKLGGIYEELKKYPEARQTYEYALKLAKQFKDDETILGDLSLPEIYFSLAWLEKEAGNFDAAFDNVLEALEFETSSPRYLDLILDLSIIRKDKESAAKYFAKLAMANPENKKLEKIKEEIENL